MMKIHVLPGDALTETFRETSLDGEIVICRECLVEGSLEGANASDFWQTRARFIEKTYGADQPEYFQKVAGEFEKLKALARSGAEVNLWFEYELFCQVNLWFTLYLLGDAPAKIYRVAPVVREEREIWKGFGDLSAAALETCYGRRVEFSETDRALGADLWKAFRTADHETLARLSNAESDCFPYLKEVCGAAIEKTSRPRAVLAEILADGKEGFGEIFPEFAARAGVYGFGDAQVKRILEEI